MSIDLPQYRLMINETGNFHQLYYLTRLYYAVSIYYISSVDKYIYVYPSHPNYIYITPEKKSKSPHHD